MNDWKITTIDGLIDNIYIKFIKNTKSGCELEHFKKFYILNNPFVSIDRKKKYLGYINKFNKKKLLANIFLNKIKKKKEKREKILGQFVNIVKYNMLVKKPPCNETDLYTLEDYDKNNKNIYVIDIKNRKWWFSIETMCKLLCNNLSYFDTETYSVMCKNPINPFINSMFNIGQLISIYEQLEKFRCVPNLFKLFRIANFDMNYFLKIYNNDVINYSYKFNLQSLDTDALIIILHNLFENNNIYYTNVNKLNLEIESVKIDVIELIRKCMLTFKNINEKRSIRKFINKYKFIMKRARRNSSTIIVLNDETEINFSDDETEINFSDDETVENLSDDETVENLSNNNYISDEDYVQEENIVEEQYRYIDNIEIPDNFTLSSSGTPRTQYDMIIEYIYEPTVCIQAYIKGYLERKKLNKLKSDMIMKIKNVLIGYLERKKIREMKNGDDKLLNYLDKMKI